MPCVVAKVVSAEEMLKKYDFAQRPHTMEDMLQAIILNQPGEAWEKKHVRNNKGHKKGDEK